MAMSFDERKNRERRLSDAGRKVPDRRLRVSLIFNPRTLPTHYFFSCSDGTFASQFQKKKKEHLVVHELIIQLPRFKEPRELVQRSLSFYLPANPSLIEANLFYPFPFQNTNIVLSTPKTWITVMVICTPCMCNTISMAELSKSILNCDMIFCVTTSTNFFKMLRYRIKSRKNCYMLKQNISYWHAKRLLLQTDGVIAIAYVLLAQNGCQ